MPFFVVLLFSLNHVFNSARKAEISSADQVAASVVKRVIDG
jgi:hypothetical protein